MYKVGSIRGCRVVSEGFKGTRKVLDDSKFDSYINNYIKSILKSLLM